MGSPDTHQILLNVLSRYEDADKWRGSTFERIKRLSNTKVGDAGQDFVEVLCAELGFECDFSGTHVRRRKVAPITLGHQN